MAQPSLSPTSAAPLGAEDLDENAVTKRYLEQVRDVAEQLRLCGSSELLRTAYGSRFLGRPTLLRAGEHLALGDALGRLYDLLVSLPERLFDCDLARFATEVGMAPAQVETVLRGACSGPPRLARADVYEEDGGFRLLEFNICSALGGFENAEINRAILQSSELARFVEAEQLAYADTLRLIVDTMRANCPRAAGCTSPPVVALVDWPSSFVTLEPRLRFMADLLEPMGLDAVACHIGELERRSGALHVHGRRIDVVYRFFLVEDLLDGPDAPGLVAPILDAVERGTVELFASLDTELYGSKGCLALLSDGRYRDAFSAQERAFIDRFLPWTRALRDEPTEVNGDRVDLVPHVLEHRADLVLKPTLLHGGIGVITGWTTGSEAWEQAIRAAVGGPYVVQRRVRPVLERFPSADGSGATEPLVLNWGIFLTDAGYGGAIVRGTADPDVGIVSMANGAMVGACFHTAGVTARA